MRYKSLLPPVLGVMVALAAASGCGSEGATGTSGTGGTATTSSTSSTSSTSGGEGGAGGQGGGTGGTTSSGTPEHGPSANEFVSGGEVSKSPSYTLVSTLGQSSQNQEKTTSPSYRQQGGLIGANGSLP